MNDGDPANKIFQKLCGDPGARAELTIVHDHGRDAVRIGLSTEEFSAKTRLSPRAAREFADDLESQAQQGEWEHGVEELVTRLRSVADAVEEAGWDDE